MNAVANEAQLDCGNSGEMGSSARCDLKNAMLRLVLGRESEVPSTTRSTSSHCEYGTKVLGRWEAAGGS